MNVALTLLTGEAQEMAEVQKVIDDAPTHAERVTGHPPGPSDALSLFSILPEGVDYAGKFVWAVKVDDGTTVGVVDVIRGWPNASTATIGLLLLAEQHRGAGIGRRAYAAVESEIRSWPQVTSLRAAVVATNADVVAFWTRMGFADTGERKPYRYDKLISQSWILTKYLI